MLHELSEATSVVIVCEMNTTHFNKWIIDICVLQDYEEYLAVEKALLIELGLIETETKED